MRRAALILVFAPGLAYLDLAPSSAWAAPDGRQIVLHGNGNGAPPCAACHGANGAGNPATGAPALAGRPAGEIAAALMRMGQGKGGNALMQSIARSLNPAEIQAVAAYFSGLPKP
ncbi:MAG TPA: c-type cytochrome [Acidocella sp.]|nr:c-type cytochrome [Acidocella sp.]